MSAAAAITTPLDILLPYQRAWVDDDARFKIGLWARQTGKSFGSAAEVVAECMTSPKALWVILSAGERQALEYMRKVRQWAEAFALALEDIREERDGLEHVLRSAEATWANGSRVVALPANPDTARGYSGHVVLDEFAFHDDPDAIWRAIYPTISNPLRGHLRLRILSTPNGRANKFYDLWTKNPTYSKHRVTIHDAVAQGLALNIDELREGLDDPEGWAQEYECEFIDASSVLLPYDLIATCEHEEATRAAPAGGLVAQGPLYVGIDIGRKHDLTVIWTVERLGDVLWTREVIELARMPYREQQAIIEPRARAAARVAIDTTGIGDMLAEELEGLYGHKIERYQFTAQSKADLFLPLRRAFEDKGLRVPIDRAIREDLHGLQKVTTSAGNVRFLAPHSDDGHCDRATALALAHHAATDIDEQGMW